jgi:putative DNA primase/helicase
MESTQRKAPDATNTRGHIKNNDLRTDYKPNGEKLPLTTGEVIINFRQAVIDNLGFAPSVITPSGKLERFSSNGKQRDLSGWYVLHLHGEHAAGAFGCWRTGIKQTWSSASGSQRLSDAEWQHIRKAIAAERAKAATEQAAKAEQAQRQAVQLWLSAQPANPAHPYLMRKRVSGYNAIRQSGNLLLVPLCDLDGTLHSLQTIAPNGEKRFLPGTPKQGMFCLIGEHLDNRQGVYLCEGYATGASLYEAYRLPVLVAFDAGNLLPVASRYHARFPHIPLTVCADNDRKTPGNPGLTKAREVIATLPGVGLIVPEFPDTAPLHLSDFNDLTALLGSNAHKETTP